jgi:predicted metal-dependent hydrolase
MGPRRASAVRDRLVAWYRARAAQKLPERVQAWAHAAGGKPIGEVIISDQRKRWASCDPKGNLRFNWRIIQGPLRLVDYVVAHELVHVRHRDHTPAFWRALEEVQGDFDDRRRRLRELGHQMEW